MYCVNALAVNETVEHLSSDLSSAELTSLSTKIPWRFYITIKKKNNKINNKNRIIVVSSVFYSSSSRAHDKSYTINTLLNNDNLREHNIAVI